MSVEKLHISDIPHCEFLKGWDKEASPDEIVWDSFCGGRPESAQGPFPCLFPAGVTGWEDCPSCNEMREKLKKEKT